MIWFSNHSKICSSINFLLVRNVFVPFYRDCYPHSLRMVIQGYLPLKNSPHQIAIFRTVLTLYSLRSNCLVKAVKDTLSPFIKQFVHRKIVRTCRSIKKIEYSLKFRKAGTVRYGVARETHWATCHNGETPSKTKEFLKPPCFFRS